MRNKVAFAAEICLWFVAAAHFLEAMARISEAQWLYGTWWLSMAVCAVVGALWVPQEQSTVAEG